MIPTADLERVTKEALTLHVWALEKRAKAARTLFNNPNHPKAQAADADAAIALAILKELP